MKRKLKKQLLSLVLTMVLSLSMGLSAAAAEANPSFEAEVDQETQEVTEASARSASGYAAHYTDYLQDDFYIDVTGTASAFGTAKMKAWDFPSTADVYVSLYRPDGSTAFANVKLPIGQEISKSFTNFQTGRYRLAYAVFGTDKGWIYNNLSS